MTPEIMYQKIILIHEGWGFVSEEIGNVVYYRAVSPDGWLSVIAIAGDTEAWAVSKAWDKREETAQAQFGVAEWLRKYGHDAGLTWDKTQDKFCASLFVKGGYPKEAFGNSPAEAVKQWQDRWAKK